MVNQILNMSMLLGAATALFSARVQGYARFGRRIDNRADMAMRLDLRKRYQLSWSQLPTYAVAFPREGPNLSDDPC